jgi:ABC-2 type transport system permease protein
MSVEVGHTTVVSVRGRRSAPPRSASVRSVVRRGLLDRWRAVLSCGISIGALGAFMAAFYPSIKTTVEDVAKNYPAGLKQAFGVQAMNTVEGYVHTEMFSLIVPVAIGYFAIRAVASATVGAEESGQLDTILSLPISRSVLMVGSYFAAALVAAGIMAVIGVMTFLAGRLAGTNISAGLVAAGVTGVWPLALFFGGVSAVASGTLHSSRTVSGISLGVLVGMYAMDLAGRLAHALEPFRWVSAFRYYGAPRRDGIDPLSAIGLAAVGAALVVLGAVLFERRDVLH